MQVTETICLLDIAGGKWLEARRAVRLKGCQDAARWERTQWKPPEYAHLC